MAPLFKSVAIPLMDSHLCSFLASVEAPHPCEHRATCGCSLHKLQITDNEYQIIQHLLSTATTWFTSAYHNCPSILIFVHVLQPLDLVMTQQLFIRMHHQRHLVVKCCTKTALPDDNSNDLTACYLLKQQPLSKSSPNALHMCSCHPLTISSPTSFYLKKKTIEQITYCTV